MKINICIASAAMLWVSSAGQAATINFDDMLGPETFVLTQSYSSLGYNFTTPTNREDDFFFFGEAARPNNWIADPVGTTMAMNYPRSQFNVSRADGRSFGLVSFELADLFNEGSFVNRALMTLNYADGTSESREFFNDRIVGLQSISVNASNLSSFSILSSAIQFDNFVVSVVPSAVPEPMSWALMVTGFGLAGTVARRRGNACPQVTA